MEDVILTHRVLAARSTVRLSESLAIGKSSLEPGPSRAKGCYIDDECLGKGLVFAKSNQLDFGLLFLAHFALFDSYGD